MTVSRTGTTQNEDSDITPVAACSAYLEHFANLLFFGRCGCWDEGRNRSAYYGWTEDDDAE